MSMIIAKELFARVNGTRAAWSIIYVISGLLAVVGIWRPVQVTGGLVGNGWLWSALVFLLLGTILRMEHWTSVALLFLVAGGVNILAACAKFVIEKSDLSPPQASVLVVLIAATTIIVGLGVYTLGRYQRD